MLHKNNGDLKLRKRGLFTLKNLLAFAKRIGIFRAVSTRFKVAIINSSRGVPVAGLVRARPRWPQVGNFGWPSGELGKRDGLSRPGGKRASGVSLACERVSRWVDKRPEEVSCTKYRRMIEDVQHAHVLENVRFCIPFALDDTMVSIFEPASGWVTALLEATAAFRPGFAANHICDYPDPFNLIGVQETRRARTDLIRAGIDFVFYEIPRCSRDNSEYPVRPVVPAQRDIFA